MDSAVEMRTHKMTTRSLATTAQEQQPSSRKARSQRLNQRSRKKFHQFSNFPYEICYMIWEAFLNDYEDNPSVAWTLIWGMDDPDDYSDPTNIRLRPYIFIQEHCQNDRLVEYNSNPLLRVSKEARIVALRNQRYVSIRAWDLDMNIIVRPSMDYFHIDSITCRRMFRFLLQDFTEEHGNPTTFTLAEDMSFVKHAFIRDLDFFEVGKDKACFHIHKNAPAATCTWCALDKLFNNCLGTMQTMVTVLYDYEDFLDDTIDWEERLDFGSRLFSGSRLWPLWAQYSYSCGEFITDEDCTIGWELVCEELTGPDADQALQDLPFAGYWHHICNEPVPPPRDTNPHLMYIRVRQSLRSAKTRKVRPRRPVSSLPHGRSVLLQAPRLALRHQSRRDTIELRTTCVAECENGVHEYPARTGGSPAGGDGVEGGDDNEGSDAWLNWRFVRGGIHYGEMSDDDDDMNDDTDTESNQEEEDQSEEPLDD
ncbi:hypothetical protein QR685DRAFT_599038 [Neurospora intermedia]|uniref:2EXR domain-containing protein n=1 Tax=Neurospora intermedia TaxID=5142 RepID=A0ABR3D6T4_NEUIN